MKNSIIIFVLLLLWSCNSTNEGSDKNQIAVDSKAFAETIKYKAGDPFIETIKESEFFKMSGLEDKIIETNNGTLISIPKGAFRDSKGNIVEKEIVIEITDINSFEEQFNANINSSSGENILLNGGALYLNATQNGSQLGLNDDSPIYIETKQESNPNLLVFEGIRNDKGEMQWINPKQPKKYLIPVNLNALDFLPKGFSNEVEKNIPFGNYTTSTKQLIDSIYYSLKLELRAVSTIEKNSEEGIENTNRYSSNYSYNDNLYLDSVRSDSLSRSVVGYCPTISPASIKVIKSDRFSNSFIATKQFEERLQVIHQTGKQEVLEVYINNLSKDLSYCDSLASRMFEYGTSFNLQFSSFSNENWSNLEKLPRSIKKLGDYYSENLKKVENELESAKIEYEKALKNKSLDAEKIREDYKQLLTKRQVYRLKKHGFTLNKLGWVAIGIKIETFTIDLEVKNGSDYDRVHVYTIDPSIKSIFAWQSVDKVNFNYAFSEDVLLVYKKNLQAKALVVAYKGDKAFCDVQDFRVTNKININFSLYPTTKNELSRLLTQFDSGSENFNKLKVDLAYQATFYKEKQRLKKVLSERLVIARLVQFVYQCKDEYFIPPN